MQDYVEIAKRIELQEEKLLKVSCSVTIKGFYLCGSPYLLI
jgi:hypothetical protein